jgi:hypothetical protein
VTPMYRRRGWFVLRMMYTNRFSGWATRVEEQALHQGGCEKSAGKRRRLAPQYADSERSGGGVVVLLCRTLASLAATDDNLRRVLGPLVGPPTVASERSERFGEGWRRGWDSNPTGRFGFCKLQILQCHDCRACQRCRGALHQIAPVNCSVWLAGLAHGLTFLARPTTAGQSLSEFSA